MKLDKLVATLLAFTTALAPTTAFADPCGMVPPLYLGDGPPIERIGLQKTYVFYKDGIETLVIRPGFQGEVDEFGMLVPFPSPPAIRKVADDVFAHVAAAVDPPEVVVDLSPIPCSVGLGYVAEMESDAALGVRSAMKRQEVVVLRREAVGMYDVAVLEAGSASALERWMDDHGFRYPDGMDAACEDYVEDGWCFVAVKARVGVAQASQPRPGMREVDVSLEPGSTFDGHVQAMGFRFRTDELVVPMRLSVFNERDLHNVVYLLADEPLRARDIPAELVVRQVSGAQLLANVTHPLPLRVIGGGLDDIPDWRRQGLAAERDPVPHNGIARELFASDLLAVQLDRLAHPHEEEEKTLLEIGERLGLRGPELDALHAAALSDVRRAVQDAALSELRAMTLTVIDGVLPREVLQRDNLSFVSYRMEAASNRRSEYDARHLGPPPVDGFGGTLRTPGGSTPPWAVGLALLGLVAALLLARRAARRSRSATVAAGGAVALALALTLAGDASARAVPDRSGPVVIRCGTIAPTVDDDVAALADPTLRPAALARLVARGEAVVPRLLAEALDSESLLVRGFAIVAVHDIGGAWARVGLGVVEQSDVPPLVRVWASAARIALAPTTDELGRIADAPLADASLLRPLTLRCTALLSEAGGASVEDVLSIASRHVALQASLLPLVLDGGAEPLLDALLGAADDEVRRLAAASLATLAGRGEDVAGALLDALRCDPDADTPPWGAGALFLPNAGWSSEDARALVGTLLQWLLVHEVGGVRGSSAQILNNLRSVGLASTAGFRLPDWNANDSATWLRAYADSYGAAALEALLSAVRAPANEAR